MNLIGGAPLTHPHLQTIKERVHQITNHLQVVIGHLEMDQPVQALAATKIAIKAMGELAKALRDAAKERGDTDL